MKTVSATWMVILAMASLAAGIVRAEEEENKEATVKGTVVAKYDDGLNVVGVTLKEDGGKVYNVTLDAKGKAMGEQMDGEKVEAKGKISKQGEAQWITVSGYQAVKKDADAGTAAPPEADNDGGW